MARLTTTADTTNVGSVWYNPTFNRLQYSYLGGAWSVGGALITARRSLAGAGTQNEGLAFGGYPTGVGSCTEEYVIGVQTCTL